MAVKEKCELSENQRTRTVGNEGRRIFRCSTAIVFMFNVALLRRLSSVGKQLCNLSRGSQKLSFLVSSWT